MRKKTTPLLLALIAGLLALNLLRSAEPTAEAQIWSNQADQAEPRLVGVSVANIGDTFNTGVHRAWSDGLIERKLYNWGTGEWGSWEEVPEN